MPTLDFVGRVRDLQGRGATLAGIEVHDQGGRCRLTYYFWLEGKNERVDVDASERVCPSLIQIFGTADCIERNLHQRYNIKFLGNPNLERGL